MTGWRLTSSIPAMMRSLSSCFDVTGMWRRIERANLEKKPSMRLSQEPCLGVKVSRSKRASKKTHTSRFFAEFRDFDLNGGLLPFTPEQSRRTSVQGRIAGN